MEDGNDINSINERLDCLEERLEDSHGEFSQNLGKSIGREVGILYGIIFALILIIIFMKLNII